MSQHPIDDPIPGAVGANHPDTAHDAADASRHGNLFHRRRILMLMYYRRDYGMTAAEAAAEVGISTQLAGSRFVELRGDGCAAGNPVLIRRTGQRRSIGNGRPGMVHVLTHEGAIEARRLVEQSGQAA